MCHMTFKHLNIMNSIQTEKRMVQVHNNNNLCGHCALNNKKNHISSQTDALNKRIILRYTFQTKMKPEHQSYREREKKQHFQKQQTKPTKD